MNVRTSMTDTESVRESIRTSGCALVPAVLDTASVQAARAACERYLIQNAEDDENEIEASELLRIQELAGAIFSNEVVGILRRLLNDRVTYYPNYVARLNRYTDWHVDNGFLPAYHADPSHLFDPGFAHLQCVIYLQDNLPGVGGGLDVVPGSHRWAADGVTPEVDRLLEAYGDAEAVDSQAGDMLVFDGRLLHRGSPSQGPAPLRKYGIFWSASRSDRTQVDRYLTYLAGRSDHLRSLGLGPERLAYMVRRYDDVAQVQFPESYLEETVSFVAASGDLDVVGIGRG